MKIKHKVETHRDGPGGTWHQETWSNGHFFAQKDVENGDFVLGVHRRDEQMELKNTQELLDLAKFIAAAFDCVVVLMPRERRKTQ